MGSQMATEDQQQKGAWSTRAPGGGGKTFDIFFILTTMLLLCQIHTTHSIYCHVTKSSITGKGVEPQDSIEKALGCARAGNSRCYLVYTITGIDDKNQTKWNLQPHTYVAGGDKNLSYDINVCTTNFKGCHINTTTTSAGLWRLDVACCCDSDYCNKNAAMNPQIYLERQLNTTNNQICRVDYEPNKRIDDCSRLTGQKETDSPSKCLSVLPEGSAIATLGCAHDDNGDRCDWTNGENGVCRISKNEELQCCCSGAFCNGDAMMNMACRVMYKYSNADDLRYGNGLCAALRPPTTTIEASTTEGSKTLMWALIGAGIAVVLVIIIVVVIVLCCWRRNKKKRSANSTGALVRGAEPTDANECTRLDSVMSTGEESKPLSGYELAENETDEPAAANAPG